MLEEEKEIKEKKRDKYVLSDGKRGLFMTKEQLEPKKWLLLEQADAEILEVGIMLEMATNAAAEFEMEENLPYVVNLACRRLHEIRSDIKCAMKQWQQSGIPYWDEGANEDVEKD